MACQKGGWARWGDSPLANGWMDDAQPLQQQVSWKAWFHAGAGACIASCSCHINRTLAFSCSPAFIAVHTASTQQDIAQVIAQ
jgi:hypothetical protein